MGKAVKAPFYRYIRPNVFDERRTEVATLPHGGVCLRFEENSDGTLWFTYARCHEKELFSKEVAKRIADQRAERYKKLGYPESGFLGRIPFTKETSQLVSMVVDWADAWQAPIDSNWMVRALYLEVEFRELSQALESIMVSNVQNNMKADVWVAGLEATNVKQQYRDNA